MPYTPQYPAVPSEGPLECDICFVGEAPGNEEVRDGRPFVGNAGKLFDQCLQVAGIIRSRCHIANVIKEHPPQNRISLFIKFPNKITQPVWESEGYKYYRSMLKSELENCRCNVVVAMGNVPLYALTGLREITKRRGSVYNSTLVPGLKVLACIHPAAANREFLLRYRIIHDMQRAVEESKSPIINLDRYNCNPPMSLIIKPTMSECMSYLHNCSKRDIVAFDIEVMQEEVSCISFSMDPLEAISIPFTHGPHDYFDPDQEIMIWRAIAGILENRNIRKLGQNLSFDSSFLLNRYGIKTGPFEDTMVAHGILYPDFPKGLDFITSMYTKHNYYKDEGKKHMRMGVSSESFWEYNAKDSAICTEVWPKLMDGIRLLGNESVYRSHCDIIPSLVYIQEHGMRLDLPLLHSMSKDVGERIESMKAELARLTGISDPAFANSPKQLSLYFYGKLKQRPLVKGGKTTTDDDAMRRLAMRGIPEAALVRDVKKLVKLKGTYYDVDLENNRLNGSGNPVGTKTGRFSFSKSIFNTGCNIQTLPAPMKRVVVPDTGCIIYNIDLAQAEEALMKSDELFRTISNTVKDAVIMMDNEGNISFWNEAAEEMFGYTKIEVG